MCECIKQTTEQLKEKLGIEASIVNLELLSGRTYSTWLGPKVGRMKRKEHYILHSYCPHCGEKYEKK